MDVNSRAAIVNKSLDAVFLGLALVMMVVVMVAFVMVIVVGLFIVIVVIVVGLFIVIVMVVVMSLGFFFLGGGAFYLANPSSRGCHLLIVKQVSVDDVIEVDHSIVGLDDGGRRLQSVDDVANAVELVGLNFRRFVQQH